MTFDHTIMSGRQKKTTTTYCPGAMWSMSLLDQILSSQRFSIPSFDAVRNTRLREKNCVLNNRCTKCFVNLQRSCKRNCKRHERTPKRRVQGEQTRHEV